MNSVGLRAKLGQPIPNFGALIERFDLVVEQKEDDIWKNQVRKIL
jgi:hypothetical protein